MSAHTKESLLLMTVCLREEYRLTPMGECMQETAWSVEQKTDTLLVLSTHTKECLLLMQCVLGRPTG